MNAGWGLAWTFFFLLIIFIEEVREAVGFLPVGLRTRESNYHPE